MQWFEIVAFLGFGGILFVICVLSVGLGLEWADRRQRRKMDKQFREQVDRMRF